MALKLVGWDDIKCRPIYAGNSQREKNSVKEKFPEEIKSEIVTENVRSLFSSPSQKNVRDINVQNGDLIGVESKAPRSKRRKNKTPSSGGVDTDSCHHGYEVKESCQNQITTTATFLPFQVNTEKLITRHKSTKLPSSIFKTVDFVSKKVYGHAKNKIQNGRNKSRIGTKHKNKQHSSFLKLSNNIVPEVKGENHQDDNSAIAIRCNIFSPSQNQNDQCPISDVDTNLSGDTAYRDGSENVEKGEDEMVKFRSFETKMISINERKERQSSGSDALVVSSKDPSDKKDPVEGRVALPSLCSNETHFTNNSVSYDSIGQETIPCSLKSGISSDDQKSSIALPRECSEYFNGVVTPFVEQRDKVVLGSHDSVVDSDATKGDFSESSVKHESQSDEGGDEIHLDVCSSEHLRNSIRYAEEPRRGNLHTELQRTSIDSITERIISSSMKDDNAADDSSSVISARDETNSILSIPNVRPTITDDLQYFSDDIDIFQNDVDHEEERRAKNERHSHPQQSSNRSRPIRSYGSAVKKPIWIPDNLFCNQNKSKSTSFSVAARIGWDHEKCRPIFYASNENRHQIFEDGEESSEGDKMMVSSSSLGECENDNNDNLAVRYQANLRKKRVYGSNRKPKKRLLSCSDHFSTPLKLPTAINSPVLGCKCHSVTFRMSSDGNEKRKFETDPQNQSSPTDVLSALKNHDSELRRGKQTDVLREKDFCILYSGASSAGTTYLNEEHNDHDRNNDAAPPSQVSSKMSLNSARAYFRHLDSTHNLTLQDDGDVANFYNAKNDVIRTRRKLKNFKRNPRLREEYRKYCETLGGSGVQPISMKEFGENWNRYFTERGVIRDGILDEE